jgi:TolA-binding protein
MKCVKARLLILELLYDEIRPRKRAALEKHLEKCQACSAELAAHRATISTFDALSAEEPPAELTRKVVSMAEQASERRRRASAPYWKPALAAAAAAVLVVVSLVYYLPQAQKEQMYRDRAPESRPAVAMKLERPTVEKLESAAPAEAEYAGVPEPSRQVILDEELSRGRKHVAPEKKPASPEAPQQVLHDDNLRRQVDIDKGDASTEMNYSVRVGAQVSGEERVGEIAADRAIEKAPSSETTEGDASTAVGGIAAREPASEPLLFQVPAKTKKARSELSMKNEVAAPPIVKTQAESLPPDDIMASARFLLGQSHQEKGDCEEAVAVYEKIISDYPEFSKIGEVHLAAGDCYLSMGKADDALHHFEIVRDTYPALRDKAVQRIERIESSTQTPSGEAVEPVP